MFKFQYQVLMVKLNADFPTVLTRSIMSVSLDSNRASLQLFETLLLTHAASVRVRHEIVLCTCRVKQNSVYF